MRIELPEDSEQKNTSEQIFTDGKAEAEENKKKKKYKPFDQENPVNVFLYNVGSLILANLLFILCSLPIITIGASLTAMNRVVYQLYTGEDKQFTKTFFSTFGHCFVDATLVWIISAGFGSMFGFGIYRAIVSMSGASRSAVCIVCGILLYCVLTVVMFYFMILSRYENTVTNNIKNAFLVGFTHLPQTVLLIVIWVVCIGVFIYFPVVLKYFGWLLIMMGFSFITFITCGIYKKIFTNLERGSEE